LWAIRYRLIPDDQLSPTRIAQLHDVQPSVVTRALAGLEAGRFIERSVRPEDGRSYEILMTERGRAVSEYVERLYVDDIVGSMTFFTDGEIDDLRGTATKLERIVTHLERKRGNRRTKAGPIAD
jgi:DNA-binding MarR family transcriptional regulator